MLFSQRGSVANKRMLLGALALFAAAWMLGVVAGGESEPTLGTVTRPLVVLLPLCIVFGGVLLLYWSVNKTAVARILRDGHAWWARETSRERVRVRFWVGIRVAVEFHSAGIAKTAAFVVAPSDAPPEGVELCVIERSGPSVAVVWLPAGAEVATLLAKPLRPHDRVIGS